jgi:hypothetical protein
MSEGQNAEIQSSIDLFKKQIRRLNKSKKGCVCESHLCVCVHAYI